MNSMAEAMNSDNSGSLIPLYRTAILDWLKATGSKTPGEIEDYIRSTFKQRWQERDRAINGNGIPQWRNDVHWARAHLTRQGLIVNGGGKVMAAGKAAPRAKRRKPASVKEEKVNSRKLYDSLTADILESLRNGTPPWRKRWGDLHRPKTAVDYTALAIPTNAETGKPYIGVNTLILWNATYKNRFPESRWATAKTWWRLAAEVKPQAATTHILAWVKVKDSKDEEDETVPIWHSVYNLAQVEGCNHLRQNDTPSFRKVGEIDTSRAWEFITKCGARVEWGGNSAHYNWKRDKIGMPHKQRFESELDLLTVLFHELGHWTGHCARLNRRGATELWDRDSAEYAFEELVAELTACFVLAHLEIPDRYEVGQHAGYIEKYIKLLENDARLRRAAGQAGKAARYLMALFGANSK